jgi:Flp pilus assembly protein TadB
VLSGLPFIAAFLLYLERPDALNPLFYDPRGRVLLAIGATSLSMGILTMRHMIRKGTTV